MGELIELENHLPKPDFELPYIENENLVLINKIKARFGSIQGFDFLYIYVGLVKKGRNILTKENIIENTLPSNLEYHISKINKGQAEFLTQEINKIIQKIIDINHKQQLFHLRNKIIQRGNCFINNKFLTLETNNII